MTLQVQNKVLHNLCLSHSVSGVKYCTHTSTLTLNFNPNTLISRIKKTIRNEGYDVHSQSPNLQD